MPATDPIIRVENMTAAYGSQVVLRELNFAVERGEVFVILGGSGCGKSTLLKQMIGLYRPTAGNIWIEKEDIATARGEAKSAIQRKIGVMYQSGALFGSRSLLQNVRLPLEEFSHLPKEGMDAVAWSKLKLVGLEDFPHHLPSEVSGGMQKRAAIARAMALDPKVLFLDEPSAGLDPVTSAELDATIKRLNQALGLTFVVVTHELASIYAIADHVIMLDPETKTLIAQGKPAELRDHSPDAKVRQFFLREASLPE